MHLKCIQNSVTLYSVSKSHLHSSDIHAEATESGPNCIPPNGLLGLLTPANNKKIKCAPYQSIHRVDHAASPSPEMHFGIVFSTAQGESLQSNPLTMDQFSKQFLITAVFVQIYDIINNITTTF